MNYYTSQIPLPLAEKLKEKGMPILIEQEWYPNGMPKAEKDCHKPMTKYCEVFDWLMEQKEIIVIDYTKYDWVAIIVDNSLAQFKKVGEFFTWHEAANAAIEKALTLI